MILACVASPLTSCNEDEPQNETEEVEHNPNSDDDQSEITGFDGLTYLQSGIVVVDENGEVVRRVYGKPLDASQPTVISVPVKDLAMAESIFLGWVAPDKKATKVENGYDYNLTDNAGNAQGSVAFRAVKGQTGVIARMSVTAETDLKQVSEVRFISADLWPENDEIAKYEAGKIYNLVGIVIEWKPVITDVRPVYKELPFYCIQGNDNGEEAILVWLCPDDNDYYHHPTPALYRKERAYIYLPSVYEGTRVLEYYNNNYDKWQAMVKYMDSLGHKWDWQYGWYTTGNSEFMLNNQVNYYGWYEFEPTCLDLDEKVGEIRYVHRDSKFYYRYMHIRIYPPLPNNE